jgi:hypothetical protein
MMLGTAWLDVDVVPPEPVDVVGAVVVGGWPVVVGVVVVVGMVVVVVGVVAVVAVVVGVVVVVVVVVGVVCTGGRCWECQQAVTDGISVVVDPFPQTTGSGRPLADALSLPNASANARSSTLTASAPSSVIRAPRSHLPSVGALNPIRPAPFLRRSMARSPCHRLSGGPRSLALGLLRSGDRPAPPACSTDRDPLPDPSPGR